MYGSILANHSFFPLDFLEFLGVRWSSLEFYEVPKNSLEFLRVFLEFFEVPWSSLKFFGALLHFSEECYLVPNKTPT